MQDSARGMVIAYNGHGREAKMGECKSWTLDSGLDHGLDYGLEYGLNSRLIFKLLAMVASHDLH